MMISKNDFRSGMRRLAAGVSLITTAVDEQFHGLAATSVSSVSADPPTLLVCINRSASAHDALLRSGCFAVNLLDHSQKELAKVFATSASRSERFTVGDWRVGRTGSPILWGAMANFECRTIQSIEVHTHTLLIGSIVDVEISTAAQIDPLLYFDGDYR